MVCFLEEIRLYFFSSRSASSNLYNLQIEAVEERPLKAKHVTYRITGQSDGSVDVHDLFTSFLPALHNASIKGVQSISAGLSESDFDATGELENERRSKKPPIGCD